jgi:alpha-D-ribose 1-methylphosphonate 5-triphosphate synthase subunit PhnI
MSYVAIKGGHEAIRQSAQAMELLRASGAAAPLETAAIERQLHFLHGKVLSEGGLYHPALAALAIKQSLGDSLEAAFHLRAYRSTRARLGETAPHDTRGMRVIRRISAAFKDIPGGQMLGPSPDYLHRLFRFELLTESEEAFGQITAGWFADAPDTLPPTTFPKVLDALRAEGLIPPASPEPRPAFDITRQPLIFPAPRSAALATMARGETGGLLTLAYSSMRGYGDVHPTVGELRVGFLPVFLPHPVTGEPVEAGEALVTECEIIAMYEKDEGNARPAFGLGYGACFGHNEVKAIAMAILDRAIQSGEKCGAATLRPAEDPEFVLLHIDGVESMGFCAHYKMPHYVTFQSDLDRLRATQKKHEEGQDVSSR